MLIKQLNDTSIKEYHYTVTVIFNHAAFNLRCTMWLN